MAGRGPGHGPGLAPRGGTWSGGGGDVGGSGGLAPPPIAEAPPPPARAVLSSLSLTRAGRRAGTSKLSIAKDSDSGLQSSV